MAYVAVKGGHQKIANAHQLFAHKRRGDPAILELDVTQIAEQLPSAVDRVMTEGGICDRELAALAIKQSAGDLVEAIFLLRAYRTTLPRLGQSLPLETSGMRIERRISATYKDLPGGQTLGPTLDYSHRLLDFSLLANGGERSSNQACPLPVPADPLPTPPDRPEASCPQVSAMLEQMAMLVREEDNGAEPTDLTRQPLSFPADRSARLQQLVRGDEGFLLALGYSTQRGYGRNHPFAGEIRQGMVSVRVCPEELGFEIEIGEISLTECQMINGFIGSKQQRALLTRGYGLAFGANERKAMAMALLDRALQAADYGEPIDGPAQDEEFVLAHADNVEAAGFVSHLKLPHYVDFQSELQLLRQMQASFDAHQAAPCTTHREEPTDEH